MPVEEPLVEPEPEVEEEKPEKTEPEAMPEKNFAFVAGDTGIGESARCDDRNPSGTDVS